jgi:hypothetical protein
MGFPRLARGQRQTGWEADHFAREPGPPTRKARGATTVLKSAKRRKRMAYLFRANDHSNAAAAAIPATANPVRFMDC